MILKSHTSYQVSGTPMYEASYVRDELGRISSKTEMVDDETVLNEYVYDIAGRLTDVYQNGAQDPVSHYDYDDNDDRMAITRQRLGDGGQTSVVVDNGTYDDTYNNAI